MLGATIESRFAARAQSQVGDVVLRVEELSVPPVLRDVDLEVRSGEILGIAGLVGSGRTELLRGIFGASPCSGRVALEGRALTIRGCSDAIANGIAMLPEDRKGQGLHLALSVRENIALPHLRRLSRIGHIQADVERRDVKRALADVAVPHDRVESAAGTLSGGNQQRVLFAKWLLHPPKVLMIDEPTKGVDVGAKQELYVLIRRLADAGVAILLVSSDFDEILGLSDRALVLSRGRVSAELEGDGLTEAALTTAAFRVVA
jgi:ribose transport system ATP-binding protein